MDIVGGQILIALPPPMAERSRYRTISKTYCAGDSLLPATARLDLHLPKSASGLTATAN